MIRLKIPLLFGEDGNVDPNDPIISKLRGHMATAGLGFRSVVSLSPFAFYSASVQSLPHTRKFAATDLSLSSNSYFSSVLEAMCTAKDAVTYKFYLMIYI